MTLFLQQLIHWVLDQDSHRTRKGYSVANMAIIRHIALNLLKAEKSVKQGFAISL